MKNIEKVKRCLGIERDSERQNEEISSESIKVMHKNCLPEQSRLLKSMIHEFFSLMSLHNFLIAFAITNIFFPQLSALIVDVDLTKTVTLLCTHFSSENLNLLVHENISSTSSFASIARLFNSSRSTSTLANDCYYFKNNYAIVSV